MLFHQVLELMIIVWNAVTMVIQFQLSKPITKLILTTRALIDQPLNDWHSVSQAAFLNEAVNELRCGIGCMLGVRNQRNYLYVGCS